MANGSVEEKKTAFRALGNLRHPSADPLLTGQLRQLADEKIAPEVQLELLTAAGRRDDPVIRDLLSASTDPLAGYRFALAGGDKNRGARIFTDQPVMACIRCHRAGADGGDAGPNLADVGALRSSVEALTGVRYGPGPLRRRLPPAHPR